MKKLFFTFLLMATARLSYCQLSSINTFTQIERDKASGVIKTTSPLNLQYAVKKVIAQNLNSLFIFAAAGFGHTFNGSSIVINDAPIGGGIGLKLAKDSPIEVGEFQGINAVNGKFIFGINLNVEIKPIETFAARLVGKKSVKHKISLGI